MQASLGLCYLAQLRGFMCVVVVLCPRHLTLPSLEATFPLKNPPHLQRLSPFLFLVGKLTQATQGFEDSPVF